MRVLFILNEAYRFANTEVNAKIKLQYSCDVPDMWILRVKF
jgi:hypothetical protein